MFLFILGSYEFSILVRSLVIHPQYQVCSNSEDILGGNVFRAACNTTSWFQGQVNSLLRQTILWSNAYQNGNEVTDFSQSPI